MIRGIVTAVPSNIVRNDDEAFVRMTGVAERRIAVDGQTTGTLGYLAASTLMQKMGWKAEDIGAIIFVTQTPDVRMPAMACHIAGMLGVKGIAFDIGQACAGYVIGLQVAEKLAEECGTVLLLAGDTVSRMCDPNDRSTYPLFGDAVSATIVQWESLPIYFKASTDGGGFESLIANPLMKMDGAGVLNFALREVPRLIHETSMNAAIDFHFFHQANALLLRQVIKKSGLDPDKCPSNISRFGNTSSCSIPLLMSSSGATEYLLARRNRICMYGFGAGFSSAGCMMEIDALIACETVEV